MPQILSDLSISEVSLVDRPANAETDPLTGKKIPRAVVALWKRDGGTPTPTQKGDRMTPQELEAKVIAMEPLVGKVAKQEADLAVLAAENAVLKQENEV